MNEIFFDERCPKLIKLIECARACVILPRFFSASDRAPSSLEATYPYRDPHMEAISSGCVQLPPLLLLRRLCSAPAEHFLTARWYRLLLIHRWMSAGRSYPLFLFFFPAPFFLFYFILHAVWLLLRFFWSPFFRALLLLCLFVLVSFFFLC